jgi:putative two-component system response regulator
VDDAPENIDTLRGVLGPDYRVLAAISGEGALRTARRSQPDLILMDVTMPEMDGYQVCVRLKTDPATASIPVIFIATLEEAVHVTEGLAAGAVDYITKPYVPALVKSRIHSHLSLLYHARVLQRKVQERTAELLETRIEIIRRLGRAAEYRDNETGTHVIRMSHYARLVALHSGWTEDEADLVMHVAPMHDIGKIGIPDRILLKKGRLNPDERAIMQRHATIGAEIIGDHSSTLLRAARVVARSHHERWDGAGYPEGLSGAGIPRTARVVALADVFDALLSNRPYKRAWPVARAVAEIQRGAGSQFDPELVPGFTAALPDCLKVMEQYRDPESPGS